MLGKEKERGVKPPRRSEVIVHLRGQYSLQTVYKQIDSIFGALLVFFFEFIIIQVDLIQFNEIATLLMIFITIDSCMQMRHLLSSLHTFNESHDTCYSHIKVSNSTTEILHLKLADARY